MFFKISKYMNKRKQKRYPIDATVELKINGKYRKFLIKDISLTGISILFDEKLIESQPHGQVWYAKIFSHDLAISIEPFVSLVRVNNLEENKQFLGLFFQSISDEEVQIIKAYGALFVARERRKSKTSLHV